MMAGYLQHTEELWKTTGISFPTSCQINPGGWYLQDGPPSYKWVYKPL